MTKTHMILTALGATALQLSAPAFAAPLEPSAPQSEAMPATAANGDARYCTVGEISGSRVSRKICKTRGDWMTQQGTDPLAMR